MKGTQFNLKAFAQQNKSLKKNEKTTHRIGENICKWTGWHRINLQNIQTALAAQYQKNKQPNQKMVRRLK